MSVAACHVSETFVRLETDAARPAGTEGACASACTTSLPLPEALCVVVAAAVVLTWMEYVEAAALAAEVTTNVAPLVAPGDKLIVAGEIVAAQPEGMSLPSERVLAAQLLLSLFVTDTL